MNEQSLSTEDLKNLADSDADEQGDSPTQSESRNERDIPPRQTIQVTGSGIGTHPVVVQLEERLTTLENWVAAAELQGDSPVEEREPSNPWSEEAQELRQGLQTAMSQLQALAERLDRLVQDSTTSLGFAVQEHFVCSSCGSHGAVAMPVHCTSCGTETSWGWWPEQTPQP